jgi:transcriptional regulator with XRE-family HTH domain
MACSVGGEAAANLTALGLTQEQMIERLGYTASPLHPQNISGFERGEREPPLPLLLAYARAVNLSTDNLIDDELDLPQHLPMPVGMSKQQSSARKRKN